MRRTALDSSAALTYITDGGVVDVELKWLVETDRYWRVKYHVILEPSGPPVKDGLINVPVNIRGFEDTGTGTAVAFAEKFGQEIGAKLKKDGVDAVIFTST